MDGAQVRAAHDEEASRHAITRLGVRVDASQPDAFDRRVNQAVRDAAVAAAVNHEKTERVRRAGRATAPVRRRARVVAQLQAQPTVTV